MKERTKNQKGITLIALIITIVVLMILAAVAINSITNEGILSQAGSTANQYNQAVKNEESYLQDYEDMLTAANGGYKDKSFKVGDEVSITVGSETHNFYVIEDKTSLGKVLLLAKGNIDTETLVQDGGDNSVAFSTEYYWETVTSPYDIKEEIFPIPESHIAAKAAYDYGVKLGGKGRLMTYKEAEPLSTDTNFKSKLYETFFWLGSAYRDLENQYDHGDCVFVTSHTNGTYHLGMAECTGRLDGYYGVRPVIEISKSKLQ